MSIINSTTALARLKTAGQNMVRGPVGGKDVALGFGATAGIAQGSLMLSEQDNATLFGNALLGVGAASGALLIARRFPDAVRAAGAISLPKRVLAVGALTVGISAVAAPLSARADVPSDGPYSNFDKADGEKVVPLPNTKKSRAADKNYGKPNEIAKAPEPKMKDLTSKSIVSSNRQGTFLDTGETDPDTGLRGGPQYIVLKATGKGDAEYPDPAPAADSFTDAFSKPGGPSVHYVIDKDGNIAKYVDPRLRANHTAGLPYTADDAAGMPGWNSAAISIAMVNDNRGTEYTFEQMEAARQLTQHLGHEFDIPAHHVLMDRHITDDAPGPIGFPFEPWRDSLDELKSELELKDAIPTLEMEDAGPNKTITNNDVRKLSKEEASNEINGGGPEYDTPDDTAPAPDAGTAPEADSEAETTPDTEAAPENGGETTPDTETAPDAETDTESEATPDGKSETDTERTPDAESTPDEAEPSTGVIRGPSTPQPAPTPATPAEEESTDDTSTSTDKSKPTDRSTTSDTSKPESDETTTEKKSTKPKREKEGRDGVDILSSIIDLLT